MHWQTNDGENGMIKTWDGNIKYNYCMATDIPTFRNSSTSMHVQENRNLWWPCHRLSQKLERPSSWTTEIIISDQHCIIENYYSSQIFSHFAGIINQYTFFIRERFQIFKKVKPIHFKFQKMTTKRFKKTSFSLKTTHNIACKSQAIR